MDSPQLVQPDLCHVCGDLACANNHQAPSCHSCRMFFRRNAARQLRCPKLSRCQISVTSRKVCAACRLAKCRTVGMKAKLNPQPRPRRVYYPNYRFLLERYIEEKTRELPGYGETFSGTLPGESFSEIAPERFPEREHSEVSPPRSSLQLSVPERACVEEISRAMSVFVNENELSVTGSKETSPDVVNMLNYYARQIISFCKSIGAFRTLSPDDQLIILKPFYFELIVIRIAFLYNSEKRGFPLVQDELSDSVIFIFLNKRKRLVKLKNKPNKRFIKCLHEELEEDEIIRNLLIAQSLFKPREHLSRPEFVRYNYLRYTNILLRYLEAKYENEGAALDKFNCLNDLNVQFCTVRDRVVAYLKTVDVNQITGVMAEVFDIK